MALQLRLMVIASFSSPKRGVQKNLKKSLQWHTDEVLFQSIMDSKGNQSVTDDELSWLDFVKSQVTTGVARGF